jgi:hypothetical protein
VNFFPNGLGEALGESLCVDGPLQCSGNVWFVNSTGGVDAASPAGKDREKPLATLAQAQTNAADNDLIVLESGHAETYTAALTIAKKLTILGGGLVGGLPSVRFTMNAAAANTFTVTANNVEFYNIYFPAALQANTATGKITANGAVTDMWVEGCYFEMGATDQLAGIRTGSGCDRHTYQRCTFISTATTSGTRPVNGLVTAAGGTCADVRVHSCIFDDGPFGFSSSAYAAFNTMTRLKVKALTLLRGADFVLTSAATGYVQSPNATGGGRIDW